MAYNKEKEFEKALKIAKDKKCYFIEQVVSFMPIAKKTFYEWFPIDSDESNAIKEILDLNKINTKSKMYDKWFESDNATLQLAFFKLIGDDNERKALSTNWNEHSGEFKIKPITGITFDE